ncbi:MAG TPA: ABC transporter permease [Verrucomicrobiae bacterium]|nr:ABC transporter permease [Verrucomicrobiae bacterium]
MRTSRREVSLCVALAVLLLVLAICAPSFYHLNPLLSLGARQAPALIVTCGLALVIISRQIDISVGSQFAVCNVTAGLLFSAGWPTLLVIVASVLAGALIGCLNGVLVAGLRLPSIVVTLATMAGLREGLRWQRQGEFVDLPTHTQWFGFQQVPGQLLIILGGVGVLITTALATKFLRAGRLVYAAGSNPEAARLAGLRPQAVIFAVFVLLGALTGLAAALNAVQSPQVDPKSGTGLELQVIAAAVVGGVAISGGRGTVIGAALGLVLLACISPALTYLHTQAYWERAIQGVVILLAVVGEGLAGRRESS